MSSPDFPFASENQLSMAELVNRVVDKGAVISGDMVISIAGVDLLYLGLKLLLSSVETLREHGRF